MVVISVLYHFRTHVFQSPAESLPRCVRIDWSTPTEVTNFQCLLLINYHVLWFDVSMYQAIWVQKVYSRTSLDKKVECFVLTQISTFLDKVKQTSFACKLEHKIKVVSVFEVRQESHDVVVLKPLVDLHLLHQIKILICLRTFLEHLESIQISCLHVLHKFHLSKSSFA